MEGFDLIKKIYTIGFTKKTAEEFFTLIEKNHVTKLIDIRLNNTSQLSAFSKFPDIEFFLDRICKVSYEHDIKLAPTDEILSRYKKKEIDWHGYEIEFEQLMQSRKIDNYIMTNYSECADYCLLCSEPSPKQCHRRLVAERFAAVLKNLEVIHL